VVFGLFYQIVFDLSNRYKYKQTNIYIYYKMFQRLRAFFQRIGASIDEMMSARESWLRTPFRNNPPDIEEAILL